MCIVSKWHPLRLLFHAFFNIVFGDLPNRRLPTPVSSVCFVLHWDWWHLVLSVATFVVFISSVRHSAGMFSEQIQRRCLLRRLLHFKSISPSFVYHRLLSGKRQKVLVKLVLVQYWKGLFGHQTHGKNRRHPSPCLSSPTIIGDDLHILDSYLRWAILDGTCESSRWCSTSRTSSATSSSQRPPTARFCRPTTSSAASLFPPSPPRRRKKV